MSYKVSMALLITNVSFATNGPMISGFEKQWQGSCEDYVKYVGFIITLNFLLIFKLILHKVRGNMKIIYMSLFQICSQKWFHLIGPFFRIEVENKTSRMQIYNIFIRSLYFLGKRNLILCNRHSQRSSCLRPLGARVAGESHHPASRGFLKEPWMIPFF